MKYQAEHPLLILGLDGGTFNIIRPLIEAGKLPNFSSLIDQGWHTDLLSTIPTATLPAWSSFLTSASPSQHGVVDLFVRTKGTYSLTPGSGVLRQLPTFAWHLSRQGYRVCSLGVPGTYPPEPLKGLCVSGFDSPSANEAGPEAVAPLSAYSQVKDAGGWGYNVFNEHQSSTEHLRGAADSILSDLAQKEKTILNLFSGTPWDLFMVHLQASDTAAHHFWHWHDKESPRRPDEIPLDALTLVYERIDQLIGRLKAKLPQKGRILIVSDHGFGGASTLAVYLNRWLHQMGYLTFLPQWKSEIRNAAGTILRSTLKRLPNRVAGWAQKSLTGELQNSLMGLARGTNVNYPQSIAFSDEFDYAPSIWLNHEGFFPHGRVSADNAAGVRQRLKKDLLSLRDPKSAHPIFERVYSREELGPGPGSESLPDLVLEPAWPNGYRPSFLTSDGPGEIMRYLEPKEFSAPKGFGMPGVHQREGIFVAWGDGISPMELPTLEIQEAGSLVYPLMGAEIPTEIPIPPPEYLEELLPYHFATQANENPPEPTDVGSNPALAKRLKSMGYID